MYTYGRKRSQIVKPSDSQNCQTFEDPSGKNTSNSSQPIMTSLALNQNLFPLIMTLLNPRLIILVFLLLLGNILFRILGIRSCTKHSIFNFISYDKVYSTFRAFMCEMIKTIILRDIQRGSMGS